MLYTQQLQFEIHRRAKMNMYNLNQQATCSLCARNISKIYNLSQAAKISMLHNVAYMRNNLQHHPSKIISNHDQNSKAQLSKFAIYWILELCRLAENT